MTKPCQKDTDCWVMKYLGITLLDIITALFYTGYSKVVFILGNRSTPYIYPRST